MQSSLYVKLSDFGLITALYAVGFKVSDTERQGRRLYFHFADTTELQKAIAGYWSGELMVSARHYSDCSKIIKGWVYGY